MISFNKQQIDTVSVPKEAAEKLLSLPDGCARLYLYGLLRTGAELTQIMAELEMSRQDVIRGLDELSAAGLLDADVGGGYAYTAPVRELVAKDSPVYNNADLNGLLQKTFGDRTLTFENYKTLYRAMELNGLSGQVMLILCEYAVNNHKAKNRVPLRYITSLAKSWGKDGVATVADAESKIKQLSEERSAEAVLRLLSIRRLPTQEEEELFRMWTEEWGFSFEAIEAAMPATTGAQYPTMKYLNGVLKKLRETGDISPEKVRRRMTEGEKRDDEIKALLDRLPLGRKSVTDKLREMYKTWQDLGFTLSEMSFAADLATKRGASSMDYLDRLLRDWASQGLYTVGEIEAQIEGETAVRRDVREMLQKAGVNKAVSGGDIAAYTRFTEGFGMSRQVVMYAAECAYGMKLPIKAMETMLSDWKRTGVSTIDEARSANALHAAKQQPPKNAPRFMERENAAVGGYDPTEVD